MSCMGAVILNIRPQRSLLVSLGVYSQSEMTLMVSKDTGNYHYPNGEVLQEPHHWGNDQR